MVKIEQGDLLITGKAKAVYATSDPEVIWLHHLDQATALNGKKKSKIVGKAYYTNAISSFLFTYLSQHHVPNHFIQQLSDTDSLVKRLEMIKVEIVTRNFAAGSFQRKYDVPQMQPLKPIVQEFYLKNDALDDPSLNASQMIALGLANETEIQAFQQIAQQVNTHLVELFDQIGIDLVDFKIELGYDAQHNLLLADELSPDNMRLVDRQTHQSLDKDVFRQNTGDLTTVYAEILDRLKTI
ncbi:phosphoribosylaminoimidazolesuccinocarboxamide synthase [Weissella diestrammenae]|uniref:Phosphoribosylaminoimidazole-succinocarboxamide synthase n=1 Tax=Weissella diestrammenae TaxID=1162633 RepID=A0A7G9T451_9LACO|nr:phosphoribosylaminoimidazolesuccinocarboxamide synthase [Weissella diestrammenae]MCM0583397.1 phosphoribosylaminoimidazolesuccinocarboxamide synthase [Weissella diestrammenae]QNN74876.1 phosphoribosylaminoimidazolesuccinocarboxamide synthase [Weissella diestrammenae]